MIDFIKQPGQRVIELGCGTNRHPQADVAVDVRPVEGVVDFTVDFEQPGWPIGSDEFDAVICFFAMEHVSYRNVPQFLREVFRIAKPGGKAVFVVPNTEAQVKHLAQGGAAKHPDGAFVEASRLLFGDQDYQANAHRSYFSPVIAVDLFSAAGFVDVLTQPLPRCATDMVIEARKPLDLSPPPAAAAAEVQPSLEALGLPRPGNPPAGTVVLTPIAGAAPAPAEAKAVQDPARTYGYRYFNNYLSQGFYWDRPHNEVVARKVQQRQPRSVLDVGCARGYAIKKLQDRGVTVQGLDVSKHAWLTRACDPILQRDALSIPWPLGDREFDLCFSCQFLEHVPEEMVSDVLAEMVRVCRRGWHGVTVEGGADAPDGTRQTLKPLAWWRGMMPENHEVCDAREMMAGDLPADYLEGDGRLKINVGCAWSMFHSGWTNCDVIDVAGFAGQFGYRFRRFNAREGVPYGTGSVDAVFLSHVLEHFSYDEGVKLLREFRRAVRPDGALRVIVPDADGLTRLYTGLDSLAGGALGIRELSELGEVNEGCARAKTDAGRLWSILHEGHQNLVDGETMAAMCRESGWQCFQARFRHTELMANDAMTRRILAECHDFLPCLSAYYDLLPLLG